jgi:hypothetical protein
VSKAPVAIKRVDQNSQSSNVLKQRQTYTMFTSHFIGSLWKPAVSHEPDAFHCRIMLSSGSDSELDTLVQIGFDYALPLCLADPHMKHSGAINEEQSKWFREFGRRHDGMLAINPIDKILEYDTYFGKNIAPERIAYSSCIPSGSVLCFSWLKANYMHVKFNDDGFADVWMKYNTQIDSEKYRSPDDIDADDEPEIVDSMLVNILGLAGPSIMDTILDGLI